MKNYKSVAQLVSDLGGTFTENSLRWQIHNAHNNGMVEHGVIVRVGRRVLIDADAFNRWIASGPAHLGNRAPPENVPKKAVDVPVYLLTLLDAAEADVARAAKALKEIRQLVDYLQKGR